MTKKLLLSIILAVLALSVSSHSKSRPAIGWSMEQSAGSRQNAGGRTDRRASPNFDYVVYVGTYTGPKSKGIYAYRYDPRGPRVEPLGLVAEVERPSWLVVHPNGKILYAVSETGNGGSTNGAISSFAIDPKTAQLKLLNRVSSGGGGPCHLAVDRRGKRLFVANYGSGSVAAFPIRADGSLGEQTSLVEHKGSSVNPRRQTGPHAHAVVLSPDDRFLFVPDLGLDEVLGYRVDETGALLTANVSSLAYVKAGAGPRHFAFHPSGTFAYLINEMGSSVTAFSYNQADGRLTEQQTISTLPEQFQGEDNSAEIEVDGKGRFLYASNRGDDSIAVFSIDGTSGKLTKIQRVPTQGKIPRNFKIDPSEHYLFVANQNSDNVVIFKMDGKTGRLSPTGRVMEVGSPVSVLFVPASNR